MQSAWLVCALVLVARSRADPEAVQPLRCFTCGGDSDACAPAATTVGRGASATDFSGQTVLCPRDRPHCATRATSPNFTSALSCSKAIAGICSLNYYLEGTYEIVCVCLTPLCNAPFSQKMQTELIKFATFNSGATTNSTKLNEMFWKLFHWGKGRDANIYNKVTEKIRGFTEATARVYSERTSTRTVAASTVIPSDIPQERVVETSMSSSEAERHAEGPLVQAVRQVEKARSQATRQVEAVGIVLDELQEDEPRAQAVQQPTAAPSDDDEDEGEGSGTDEESPGHRALPAVPAVPDSHLPADENHAPPVSVNFITISSLFCYMIM